MLDINVVGTARVTRAALPALRRSPYPAIVNVCSVASVVGLPSRVLYSASKGAILAMTTAMAVDFLAEGIRVNAVNPGTTDTPWVQRLLESSDDPVGQRQALVQRQPHGRLVTAEEVAAAVDYLASCGSRVDDRHDAHGRWWSDLAAARATRRFIYESRLRCGTSDTVRPTTSFPRC